MFTGVLGSSMLWKAADRKLVEYEIIDLRQFGLGKRKTVDDTPYGGGDGMLLKPEPVVFSQIIRTQSRHTLQLRLLFPCPIVPWRACILAECGSQADQPNGIQVLRFHQCTVGSLQPDTFNH